MWHDSQETRIGDIPHSARPYVDVAPNERITEDQTAALPDNAAKSIREAVSEYESQDTLESRCAKTPTASNASSKPSDTENPATPE